MHTIAFTQRFGLPAFIAATFHVIVLFAFNHPVVRIPPIEELPTEVTKIIPVTIDILTPPPPDPSDKVAEVRPLAQGAAVPESVDNSANTGTIVIAAVDVPRNGPVDLKIDKVPTNWSPGGDGTGKKFTAGTEWFTPDKLDNPPRAKVQVSPVYPAALRQVGVEGTVLVEFEVDRAGNVTAARALQSSHREFEAPAVSAVLKWKFEPGRHQGKVVPFRMAVPIGFTITAD